MNRRICFILLLAIISLQGKIAEPKTQPLNILLFTADDLDRNSLGCYGSKVPEISPNIDKFATQSLLFEHAFVNSAICVPSRGILATGLYEHNSGVNGFFKMNEESRIPLIMEILREHNYRLGILGKLGHSTPKKHFQWDYAFDEPELGNGRSPEIYYQKAKAFLNESKQTGKPFYFMVNSHDPHRPFFNPEIPLKNGEERPSRIYSPAEITVPGYVPDLPDIRKELSFYYNSTRRLDDTFGKVIQALEESGLAENTLVIFLSDNGIAIPFAKANTYHVSNYTPFIVRWPGVVKPGNRNNKEFISTIDYLPTVLAALRIDLPVKVDGKSFLPLLKNESQKERDKVFAQIDYKAGGGATPMRSVEDSKYLYIYNAWADGERVYANNNEGLTMKAMELAAETDSLVSARVNTYKFRKMEELYDLQVDPDCLNNLAADKQKLKILQGKRTQLEKWMIQTHDPLLPVFQQKNDQAKALQTFYNIFPESKALDQNKSIYSKVKGKNDSE